jgi:enamine deaminase RidA (YjgF/YER057c/UK114 family)
VIDLDAVHGPTVAPWDDGGVSAPDLHDGVPYSYFSIAPEGGLVFAAGACPLDEDGETVAPGDVAAQAGRAVANLLASPSTLLGVTTLGFPDQLVEIEAVALRSR